MQHFISSYGYLAIFVLMMAESACIPVPSELTMPLGGALAAGAVAGVHLSLPLVIVTGIAGNVAGSYLAWAVGLHGGTAAARRRSRLRAGRSVGIERAQRWFDRHGARAVCVGRLLPVVRTFISLPAGFARMPAMRFGVYTIVGCVPWVAGLAGAGYALGARWQHISRALQAPTYAIAGTIGLLAAGAIVVAVRARRHSQHAQRDGAPAGARHGEQSGAGTPARRGVPAEAGQQKREGNAA